MKIMIVMIMKMMVVMNIMIEINETKKYWSCNAYVSFSELVSVFFFLGGGEGRETPEAGEKRNLLGIFFLLRLK